MPPQPFPADALSNPAWTWPANPLASKVRVGDVAEVQSRLGFGPPGDERQVRGKCGLSTAVGELIEQVPQLLGKTCVRCI